MPYDDDGTVIYVGTAALGALTALSGAQMIGMNGSALQARIIGNSGDAYFAVWAFFPELREVTGYYAVLDGINGILVGMGMYGSTDTTNGLDGTWETASITFPPLWAKVDDWRAHIVSVSFTGAKVGIKVYANEASTAPFNAGMKLFHLYGEKAAGQTPDDLLFLDPSASDAEFSAPIDFGDRPLGTTTVKQFKVQNGSSTKTANGINLQCNDADFAISTDDTTWVSTINITSLAAGVKSSLMYVRNTTPSPGAPLGPRFARIVGTVSSYS
ncbi:MAG: hypothetical protein ACRDGQ_06675 [Candidatus Limnocylindrales bacterium]